jgi:hypothetical protein
VHGWPVEELLEGHVHGHGPGPREASGDDLEPTCPVRGDRWYTTHDGGDLRRILALDGNGQVVVCEATMGTLAVA